MEAGPKQTRQNCYNMRVDKMTEQQLAWLQAALKATSLNFAQPQQAHILGSAMRDVGKLAEPVITEVLNRAGFVLNASAQLQDLKKDGVIADELSSTAKARVEKLKKSLAGN